MRSKKYLVRVVVTQLVKDKYLHIVDFNNVPAGSYEFEIEAAGEKEASKRALNSFFAQDPIASLKDFKIHTVIEN